MDDCFEIYLIKENLEVEDMLKIFFYHQLLNHH